MIIKFYKNYSELNKVKKDLRDEIVIENAKFRGEDVIYKPTIRLKTNKDLVDYNYAYIPENNRFYFFNTPVTYYRTGIMEVDLKVDVLSSAWNDIQDNNAILLRHSNLCDHYVEDDMLPMEKRTDFNKYVSSSPFSDKGSSISATAQNCIEGTIPSFSSTKEA